MHHSESVELERKGRRGGELMLPLSKFGRLFIRNSCGPCAVGFKELNAEKRSENDEGTYGEMKDERE